MTADQQPSRNDTTTAMCKCGHSGFEHENGDNDHICRSCNCWIYWPFKQTAAVPPPTSTPADHRQNSVGAQQQPSGNDEQKFVPYFADANRQIDELESKANGKKSQIDSDLLKSKIEIVKKLAQKIEKKGFPIERIANEIVHQLKGRISPTHIRDNLDDKYKDRRQSSNAKKRKVATPPLPFLPKQQPSDATVVSEEQDLATPPSTTVVPAERNQQIIVGVDGLETTDSGSEDPSMDPPSNDLKNLPIDPPTNQEISIESPEDSAGESSQPRQQQNIQPIISTQQQSQSLQQIRVLIDWDELQDKMAEVHHKDIKSFWLCGRIENGTKKLLDMVLEREQPQMVVA